jgi:hypothetical protein
MSVHTGHAYEPPTAFERQMERRITKLLLITAKARIAVTVTSSREVLPPKRLRANQASGGQTEQGNHQEGLQEGRAVSP